MFTSGKHTRKKSINRGCRLWGRQRNNLTIPTIGISPHVAGQFCPFSNIPDFRTVCLRILTHEPSTSQCVEANNCAAAWFHSIVRLKKLSAWHRFTYTQLYPLCWDRCFMTYSMSQRDGDRCRSLKYPSRCSIASTSFYLQSDLGSDQLPPRQLAGDDIGRGIAVVFGAAYWQASDQKLFTCYALLAVVGALIVAHHFTPHRRVQRTILPHAVLTILFVSPAWLARGPRPEEE